MSHFDDDLMTNTSSNPHFSTVLEKRISRRGLLRGGATVASVAVLSSFGLTGCLDDDNGKGGDEGGVTPLSLGFTPVAKHLEDFVVVPQGYSARVLYALGDPISDAIGDYLNDGTDVDFDRRAGDHHDGMAYFPLPWGSDSSDRGIMCINHENLTDIYLHPNGPTEDAEGNRPKVEVDREMNGHGVSVIEIAKDGSGHFQVQRSSSLNRRITPFTGMDIRGPVRGSRYLVTRLSADGTRSFGTLNNCANGTTPWGTYLTCEENWFGYFTRGEDAGVRSAADNASLARYGIGPGRSGWAHRRWNTVEGDLYKRFDITQTGPSNDGSDDFRNEPNTFGWVVEIDPYNPSSTPRKRTALGRFVHEGAWVGKLTEGEPVAYYMGDDARGEYVYKFVSDALWDPADANAGPAAGDKYLDSGTLYVARFLEDGSGEWLELSYGVNGLDESNPLYPFDSQAAVLVNARLAADHVGATPMDRPEWGTVHPHNGEIYMTMTNNRTSVRPVSELDAANPRAYTDSKLDGSSNRPGNINGHIIRWREMGDTGTATRFQWDIYLFGAEANSDPAAVNLSALTDSNDFSSPDGLWFDSRGLLWIETDDGAYTDVTNDQVLVAIPGQVGDGRAVAVTSAVDGESKTVTTYVGAQPGQDLRRFLVGVKGCELTGLTMTPDYRALFVNIQHPGEDGDLENLQSSWPSPSRVATVAPEAGQRPRSATIVITRDDGGVIAV